MKHMLLNHCKLIDTRRRSNLSDITGGTLGPCSSSGFDSTQKSEKGKGIESLPQIPIF